LFAKVGAEYGVIAGYAEIRHTAQTWLDRANSVAVNARTIVNARLTLPFADKRGALGVEVKNITNNQIADAIGYPLPGRAYFVTLSYRFGAHAAAITQ
jgi:iron complex outermembrane receptor protein